MPRAMRPLPSASIGYLWHGVSTSPSVAAEMDHAVLYDLLGHHAPVLEPDPPAGCYLDLTTTGRYAPPLATRALAVLTDVLAEGYTTARLGVAPTPGVARLAAQYGVTNPLLLAGPNVAAFLAPLPVSAIAMVTDDVARLHLVGLHTLGDLRALPRGALGDYLGPAATPLEAVARGEDARPLIATRAPLVVSAVRELDYALTTREQLAHLLDRLLLAPLAALRREGLGVTQATLALERVNGVATFCTTSLSRPTTDGAIVREALMTLLEAPELVAGQEDESPDPGAGITSARVTLAAPRPLESRQRGLFDVPRGQERRLRAGVIEARRRATARLGHLRATDPAHMLPERRYTLDTTTATTREDGDA